MEILPQEATNHLLMAISALENARSNYDTLPVINHLEQLLEERAELNLLTSLTQKD